MSKGSKQRPGAGYAEGYAGIDWGKPIPGVPLICTACNTEPCDCERTEDGPGQDGASKEVKTHYERGQIVTLQVSIPFDLTVTQDAIAQAIKARMEGA